MKAVLGNLMLMVVFIASASGQSTVEIEFLNTIEGANVSEGIISLRDDAFSLIYQNVAGYKYNLVEGNNYYAVGEDERIYDQNNYAYKHCEWESGPGHFKLVEPFSILVGSSPFAKIANYESMAQTKLYNNFEEYNDAGGLYFGSSGKLVG